MPYNLNTQSIQNMNDLIFQFTGKNQGTTASTSHIPMLNDLLQKHHAFIAGSASLSSYVQDSGIVPGDLDIWVPINSDNKCTWIKNPDYVESDSDDSDDSNYVPKNNIEWIQDMSVDKFRCKSFIQKDFDDEFIGRCAYKTTNEGGNTEAKDYIDTHNRFAKYIHRIHTYTKGSKKIQVIYINVDRDTLLNTFDLSFCATTWNGVEFYSLVEPELTEQKIGYRLNNYKLIESEEGVKRENERIAKYKVRGFTICENKESATALASALNVIESSRQALLESSLYKVL